MRLWVANTSGWNKTPSNFKVNVSLHDRVAIHSTINCINNFLNMKLVKSREKKEVVNRNVAISMHIRYTFIIVITKLESPLNYYDNFMDLSRHFILS